MIRKKRAYVPRIRGCTECSRRRVDCDGAVPSCLKCTKRGIKCSGYGLKFKSVTAVQASTKHVRRQWHPEQLSPCEVDDDGPSDTHGMVKGYQDESAAFEHELQNNCSQLNESASLSCASPSSLNSWNQYLLLYFSENIAPILVLIDDQSNGWRRLVLPLAHSNELIMGAVISASTFGYSARVPTAMITPNTAYQTVIRTLRQMSNSQVQDILEKQYVALALLLLLAGNIVNGSSDFRAILRLIETFSSAVNDDDIFTRGELGRFLSTQIAKFRGYASPFLSQQTAIEILSLTILPAKPPVSKGWTEFLSFCEIYPHLSSSMSIIYEVNQKACEIYVSRVSAGPDRPDLLTDRVDECISTLRNLPIDSPGEYSLVWPVFIVALESSTTEQRQFFYEFLLRQYRRSSFDYVAKAMGFLMLEWKQQSRDWTQRLIDLEVFVV